MKRLYSWLPVLLLASVLWNCSEDAKTPAVDETVPEVRMFLPFDTEPNTFVVSDSIDTYVGAYDVGFGGVPGGIAQVELFFNKPDVAEPVRIGSTSTPISVESIPDSAMREIVRAGLPPDWRLYTRRWYTGPSPLPPIGTPITSGTYVRIFAIATDLAGNQGRTVEPVRVVVFNEGEDLRRPRPSFTVTPQTAVENSFFTFDPSPTEDDINSDREIRVRWDFNGNPNDGWDIDWDQDARADEIVRRSFANQGIYTIAMEAHNSYLPFPDSIAASDPRQIRVTPPGGEPDPPDPENYVRVPAGLYPIGKADTTFVLDGRRVGVDNSEQPAHLAEIRQPFEIGKYEISNRRYLDYLQTELDLDVPTVQYAGGAIWNRDPNDPTMILYCSLDQSKIYYDLDREGFYIVSGFDDHPVTGVTWDGAWAYALSYGMRLPTEAEWEAAARGTAGDLDYPFPGGIDLSRSEGRFRVNFMDARQAGDPFEDTTTPVGFYNGQEYQGFQTIDTKSEFGLYDMAGNVAEWVNDWFGAYRPGTDVDPQGPTFGTYRVARGGSHIGTRVDCRATARRGYLPNDYGLSVGFRCAYNPLEGPRGSTIQTARSIRRVR